MRIKTCLLLVALLSAAGLHRQGAMGATREAAPGSIVLKRKLETRLAPFDSGGEPMADLVLGLAFKYRLPLGLEYADRAAVRQPIGLKLRHPALLDVLAAIVRRLPEYKMDVANGLVQIYSPKAREDPSNLLNTRMRDFALDGVDTHQASADLGCSMARTINPRVACVFSIAPGQWGPLKITLRLRGARVYEILDAMVAQNGAAVWTVLAPPDGMAAPGKDLWYIYPLDPAFRQTAIDRLHDLFPSAEGQ